MLEANHSFAQKTRSSAHNAIVTKEIQSLQETKRQIVFALQSNHNKQSEIQRNKRQIMRLTQASIAIQQQISEILQNSQQIQEGLKIIEQEKLCALMNAEEKQARLEYLQRNVAEYCKSTPSKIDLIRFKMIEVESKPAFQSLQPYFSLRKTIITFLKDKSLIKSQYRFGAQLQISRKKLSEEFKWFAIAILKSCKSREEQTVMKHIHQYFIYLKTAEQYFASHKNQQGTIKVNIQGVVKQIQVNQQQLFQMEQKIRQICKRGNQLRKRVEQLKLMIKQAQQNKKQVLFKIEMIKEKNHCLEVIKSNQNELRQNLQQVNQAIQYFYSKNLQSSKLNLSIGEGSVKQFLISPTSCTSLPLCDSIVKSQFIRSPKKKFSQNRSSSKLLISTSPKYRRMKSPIKWK